MAHGESTGQELERTSAEYRGVVSDVTALPLRVNFSWTLAGSTVYATTQWGVLIVLARLGSPDVVGRFALALAITAPVMLMTNLNLRAVQVTDARREFEFSEYLGLRLVSNAAALAIIIAIVIVAGYGIAVVLVILAVAVGKAIESTSDVFLGLLQQRERMDRIAKSRMMKGVSSLAIIAVVFWLSRSLLAAVAAYSLVWLLVLVLYDRRSGAMMLAQDRLRGEPGALGPAFDIERLRRLAWLAAPLGVVMLLISLYTNVPRYFLDHHVGAYELGVFAAMTYLIVAGLVVVNALGQSASPRMAQRFANGDVGGFVRLLGALFAGGVIIGLGGVGVALIAGQTLLRLLYGPEYADRADVFVLIMVAAGILYAGSLLGYGMTAARSFRAQAPLFLIVTLATLSASALLIPDRHLHGAAQAMIIGAITQLVGSFVIVAYAVRSSWQRSESG